MAKAVRESRESQGPSSWWAFTPRGRSAAVAVGLFTATAIVDAYVLLLVLAANWPDILFGLDFVAFWTGASMVRDGAGPALFDMDSQRQVQTQLRLALATTDEMRLAQGHMPFISPPALAFFLLPLAVVPMPTAYVLWAALSLCALMIAVTLPLRFHTGANRPMLVAAMISHAGVTVTLVEGQVNTVMALAFGLSLWAFGSGRPLLGGILLGALWLKPQYAILFPLVFLLKRQWLALGGMIVSGSLVTLISIAVAGLDGVLQYLQVLQGIGGFWPPSGAAVSPHTMINWRGLLINVWPTISEQTGSFVVLLLGGITVLGVLLCLDRAWKPSSPRFAREMLVVILATLIAVPHSHFHGLVLALPAVALVLANSQRILPLNRMLQWMLVGAYAIGIPVLIVRHMSWLMVPFGLAMIVVLIVQCRSQAPICADA